MYALHVWNVSEGKMYVCISRWICFGHIQFKDLGLPVFCPLSWSGGYYERLWRNDSFLQHSLLVGSQSSASITMVYMFNHWLSKYYVNDFSWDNFPQKVLFTIYHSQSHINSLIWKNIQPKSVKTFPIYIEWQVKLQLSRRTFVRSKEADRANMEPTGLIWSIPNFCPVAAGLFKTEEAILWIFCTHVHLYFV